jgi:hypothetical protein
LKKRRRSLRCNSLPPFRMPCIFVKPFEGTYDVTLATGHNVILADIHIPKRQGSVSNFVRIHLSKISLPITAYRHSDRYHLLIGSTIRAKDQI